MFRLVREERGSEELGKYNIYRLLLFYIIMKTGLKAVFSHYKVVPMDRLAWTSGNGDPMHEVCVPHRIPRT